jgi:hypothetical protein
MVRPLYEKVGVCAMSLCLVLLHSLYWFWFPQDLGPIPQFPVCTRTCFPMFDLSFCLEDGSSRDIPEFDNATRLQLVTPRKFVIHIWELSTANLSTSLRSSSLRENPL